MSAFHDFLREQVQHGPMATEDVLVAFLPLLKQVIAAHEYGDVAPLEGLAALHTDGGRIWFAEGDQLPQRRSSSAVRRALRSSSRGFEIVRQRSRTLDVDDGELPSAAEFDQSSPVKYLPGYVCWEHSVNHHDPTTDVFSLGLILASLACGLDLADPDDHRRFVEHRTNLFRINPSLHPVIARVIGVTTELDRRRRPQNLPALLSTIENYRDQEVDFETDLARDQQVSRSDHTGKRRVILSKLQERLFEINRRNRLLQFRSTLQTVNLTHASIPISCDIMRIRDNQVLTWKGKFRDSLLRQKPISLNSFLNFRESVYLPGTLDRIRAEARRDENEYGFAQLRLIVAFLKWSDLKSKPAESYESPLLMLPVKLDVKKGIHDRYTLTATDNRAEVNPVVRHLFKQLYDIDLPESVDPGERGIAEFLADVQTKIHASDSSVALARIEKPRIEIIHDKARRRLDQFIRRARLAGRGIRSFMDLDYSYDSINYHPLGIRIFQNLIAPAKTHLERILTSKPARPWYAVEDAAADTRPSDDKAAPVHEAPPPEEPAHEEPVAESAKSFYTFSGGDGNPYNWEFDLCSVTLANLKYRRMSLVRDYTQLVAENTENAAFEATFSMTPVNPSSLNPESIPLEERFHVVPCDPTQMQAISHARTGDSYIIQGPPGTGKSQTITNLIADFVIHGKRVLFVCEKRAAIDVVYHRLVQQGLQELCCLIHDSQADKKQFVMDLKATYEAFVAGTREKRDRHRDRRQKTLASLREGLQPLERYSRAMSIPVSDDESGDPNPARPNDAPPRQDDRPECSPRSVLDRLIELREHVPQLLPREWERVPHYTQWLEFRDQLAEFSNRLKHVQQDGVLANHPLCLLSSHVADADHPLELVTECLEKAAAILDGAEVSSGAEHVPSNPASLAEQIAAMKLPSEVASSLSQLFAAVEYAGEADFLVQRDLLPLLDPKSDRSKLYSKRIQKLQRADKAVDKAKEDTFFWKRKLSSEDTCTALQQARQFEQSLLSILKPSWWKLRRILHECYDFSKHLVKPTWTQILEQLDQEHDKRAARYSVATAISDEFGIHLDFDRFHSQLTQLREALNNRPGPIRNLNRHVLASRSGSRTLQQLAALKPDLDELCLVLDRCLEDYRHRSLPELRDDLARLEAAIHQLPDYLHCLASLKRLPAETTAAIRTLPLTLTQLEAAAAEQTLKAAYRRQPQLSAIDAAAREKLVAGIADTCDRWQTANADCIREQVRQTFADNIELSSRSAAGMSNDEKEFKRLYSKGRREIEHEFGKSMRYKSIRELASAESGRVIRDLKPVWLMSPLSVSDTLPLSSDLFDVVIFDEASQITLEEAIPSLFRAEQTIVVGDEMQLPPTSFFASRTPDDEDGLQIDEGGEIVQYDLNSSSFLNHAARNLPSRMLGWHYRSRSESLISFSNHAFYNGRLLTVPDERRAVTEKSELLAESSIDGSRFADELLRRPVSFHFLQHGVYEKRRNAAEADYIAQLVRRVLLRDEGYSIGVVAFSEAQQDEIDGAIRRLADGDDQFAELLERELEREEDGQFAGLLIKNLENIQGDERDIVILSVCYGPDQAGKIRMNFGPINQSGGEKRLNVAFSRAKHFMALVSSMRWTNITNEYNDGANCLKNYLRYAETCSVGQTTTVETILRSLSGRDEVAERQPGAGEAVVRDIAGELTSRGFCADIDVGQSHFRCDLAVYRPGDTTYRLGILVDGRRWYAQSDLLERELMRPQLLKAYGWNVCIVLARDWYHDRPGVVKAILSKLNSD
ncbi:MAG: AAA domain-containing protein [Planctomycetaceae bacterium]